MLKIMLVDDEPFILRTLSQMIEDAKDNWKIVAAVEDGEEAIEVLSRERIDLIVSDIRMPAVDGMELVKCCDLYYPDVKVILLTGYKDFEYTQQAIKSGVADYILKPGSLDTIFESIERVEKKKIEERNRIQLQQQRERGILEKRLDDLLFDIPLPHYDNALFPAFQEIRVVSCGFVKGGLSSGWKETTAFHAVKNLAEEWFAGKGVAYGMLQDHHIVFVVFITNASGAQSIQDFKKWISSLQREITNLLKIGTLMGIGTVCADLENLSGRYRESLLALESLKDSEDMTNVSYDELKLEHEVASDLIEKQFVLKKNGRVIGMVIEQMINRLGEPLTLKMLADEVYLHPTYLGRIFKETTGQSFSKHLMSLRIEKAKKLLANPTLKVYEVCEQIGYSDPAHFTHVFKKIVGVTPYEYKSNA
ncbi:response regulator [Paenibacillus macerans]|uniref:response regulator n=1 Tax=Paenibacillus macerans TaxID=44252 RepID=UPI00203FFFFB|nr:response regulator [Paenibacillus macerans]MCM3699698.1 response regulator [Paenibacillus macerans]